MQCVMLILESGVIFPIVRKYYRRSEGNVVDWTSRIPANSVILPVMGRRPTTINGDVETRPRVWTVIGPGEFTTTNFSATSVGFVSENSNREFVNTSTITEVATIDMTDMSASAPKRRNTIG